MLHLSSVDIFERSAHYEPQNRPIAIEVGLNEYGIISSENDASLLLTHNVSNCVGVAMFSKGTPNIGAILHIYNHSGLFHKSDTELEQHVKKAWNIFTAALAEKGGGTRSFEGYVLGGWPITYNKPPSEPIPQHIKPIMDDYIAGLSQHVRTKNPNSPLVSEWPTNKMSSTIPDNVSAEDMMAALNIFQRQEEMDLIIEEKSYPLKMAFLSQDIVRYRLLAQELQDITAQQEVEIMHMWSQTVFGDPSTYGKYLTHDTSTTMSNALSECVASDGRFRLADLGFIRTGHDAVVDIEQGRVVIASSRDHDLLSRVENNCSLRPHQGTSLNL